MGHINANHELSFNRQMSQQIAVMGEQNRYPVNLNIIQQIFQIIRICLLVSAGGSIKLCTLTAQHSAHLSKGLERSNLEI